MQLDLEMQEGSEQYSVSWIKENGRHKQRFFASREQAQPLYDKLKARGHEVVMLRSYRETWWMALKGCVRWPLWLRRIFGGKLVAGAGAKPHGRGVCPKH